MWREQSKYQPLGTIDDSAETQDRTKLFKSKPFLKSQSRWTLALRLVPWLAQVTFLIILSTLLYKAQRIYAISLELSGPPITQELGKKEY
jgi:hypothetical protein